jgi:putative addiction module CopG family antidote
MSTFEVKLPPALSAFLRRQIEAGVYDTPSAAIEDAVRRLSETDDAKLAALRAAIAPGVAEAEAGVFYHGTMEDIIAEARAARRKRK